MIKKFFKNRVVLSTLILSAFTYITEMIVRIFTGAPFNDFAVVRILLSSIIISLFVSFIGHFLPKLGQRILNIIYILFVGIYNFAEFGLSSYIGFFMGIGNADQGTKVGEFIRDFFSSYKVIHYTILIPLIIFLIYYIFIDRFVTKNIKRNSEFTLIQKIYIEVVTVVIIIILSSAYYATIRLDNFKNKLQTESNYGLWLYPENSNLTVNNFGVLMFGFCDIKASILHIDADYVMNLNL